MKCACPILTDILNSLYNSFDRRKEGTSAETSVKMLETLQFAADDSTSGNKCLCHLTIQSQSARNLLSNSRENLVM